MSNNEFTTKEEQPSQDAAQPQKAAPANKWAQDAMHPEKALFRTWLLVAIGLAIRIIMPMLATNGIMIIPGFAVLAVAILPAVMVGTTLYYNKNIKDSGKAWLLGSAALVTGFGIYLRGRTGQRDCRGGGEVQPGRLGRDRGGGQRVMS